MAMTASELILTIISSSAATAGLNFILNRAKIKSESVKIKAETHEIIASTYSELVKNLTGEVERLKQQVERMQKREEHYLLTANSMITEKNDLLARIQKLEKYNAELQAQIIKK